MLYSVRSSVLTALNMKSTIFSEVTQYTLVEIIDVSGEGIASWLVPKSKLNTVAACSVDSSNLKMEAVHPSYTFVNCYQAARHHVTECSFL
jgi:hypothetical protein